jgi:nucleotide-binding universal stress UspA family protein
MFKHILVATDGSELAERAGQIFERKSYGRHGHGTLDRFCRRRVRNGLSRG